MSTDCRLFITDGTDHWRILSFAQNQNDASIYVSAPYFDRIKWLHIDPRAHSLTILDSPGEGKLSVHGSGIAHVRPYDGTAPTELRFEGNLLKGSDRLGVRHLFTAFLPGPDEIPLSPAFARKSDQALRASKLQPYAYVFWAVPATRQLQVTVSASFQADDLDSIPPDSGWGAFPLALHSVVWFAYRTKHMLRWPLHPHLCVHDGYHVPLLIGTSEGECRLELRVPRYALDGDILAIQMHDA